MVVDIFIRSYHRDFDWLKWCLRSIAQHCRGFRDVVVVVPESSRARLDRFGLHGVRTLSCPNYPLDYLGQQVTKLHADFLTDADFICHVDSDWIFVRPCTPGDLIEGDKAAVVMTPYRLLHPDIPWRRPTERFLGGAMPYEFMRRQPYTFPRWLYPAVRDHALQRHRVDIETYVLRQPPLGFSEFNALGGYALQNHQDRFAWRNVSVQPLGEPLCWCFWSWGGLTPAIQQEIEVLLASSGVASADAMGRTC